MRVIIDMNVQAGREKNNHLKDKGHFLIKNQESKLVKNVMLIMNNAQQDTRK